MLPVKDFKQEEVLLIHWTKGWTKLGRSPECMRLWIADLYRGRTQLGSLLLNTWNRLWELSAITSNWFKRRNEKNSSKHQYQDSKHSPEKSFINRGNNPSVVLGRIHHWKKSIKCRHWRSLMLYVYTTLQYCKQTPILQTKWLMTIETEDVALTVMQSRSHPEEWYREHC